MFESVPWLTVPTVPEGLLVEFEGTVKGGRETLKLPEAVLVTGNVGTVPFDGKGSPCEPLEVFDGKLVKTVGVIVYVKDSHPVPFEGDGRPEEMAGVMEEVNRVPLDGDDIPEDDGWPPMVDPEVNVMVLFAVWDEGLLKLPGMIEDINVGFVGKGGVTVGAIVWLPVRLPGVLMEVVFPDTELVNGEITDMERVPLRVPDASGKVVVELIGNRGVVDPKDGAGVDADPVSVEPNVIEI